MSAAALYGSYECLIVGSIKLNLILKTIRNMWSFVFWLMCLGLASVCWSSEGAVGPVISVVAVIILAFRERCRGGVSIVM